MSSPQTTPPTPGTPPPPLRLEYPAQLPVSEGRDDLIAAIRDHQIVIVAGETGSGKTTQLPKICLEAGRGTAGMIGHTQPRRIAARAVAERLADEMGTEVGAAIGYAVRFTDQVGPDTVIKLMTDGILLAEITRDRQLRRYDTIIIDEAHERTLNIDFLLGYLKQLLVRRPDLKLIITSATIELDRFAAHFDGAPVIEVSGRTFPVEIRYRPQTAERPNPDRQSADSEAESATGEPQDEVTAVGRAVRELSREGGLDGAGDILVFLSGEREIRDTADALTEVVGVDTEVLPLYGRLSAAEQHKVFAAHRGRRIVLSTNVAETSLTVPGIRYVIDAGTARISRYSQRLKVQRLPIEPISQASARQRSGRCGRQSDGICIRLYSEEDFLGRPEYTQPEILRTSLAAVILQMAALALGPVADFPFLDPPDRRQIRAGEQLLTELAALEPEIDGSGLRLTSLGRRLARLPLDPRLGRMVLEADRLGCLREVLVVAAGLSVQDPRERPTDAQQAADEQHARFRDPESDFLGFLHLWDYLIDRQRELSSSAFRRMCRAEYLHYLRVREWQDVHAQLRQVSRQLKLRTNSTPAPSASVHQALLSGLLSQVGMRAPEKPRPNSGPRPNQRPGRPARGKERSEYLGARGAKFMVAPGSVLTRKSPRWLMAAELVETNRLWARVAAKVEPEWIEQLAGHLVTRTYSEPQWDIERASAVAMERVTLYGLPLAAGRRVAYGRIDPEVSRDLFLRHAMVDGEWRSHHGFLQRNRDLLADAGELQHRTRRLDLVIDDENLFAFYDSRIPADIVSGAHFDRWWRNEKRKRPGLLTVTREELLSRAAAGIDPDDYPDSWLGPDGVELPLSYTFDPGEPSDGVTVHVPVALLGQLDPEPFRWQVPGLRSEVLTTLIRGLPKEQRRTMVPVPDHVAAVLAEADPAAPLAASLSDLLAARTGTSVPTTAWRFDALPPFLRMNFEVENEAGTSVASGKNLEALQAQLGAQVRKTVSKAGAEWERDRLTRWDFGPLPTTVPLVSGGQSLTGYPALVDAGDSVSIRIFGTAGEQAVAMRTGLRRLLLLALPSPVKAVAGRLSTPDKLTLSAGPQGSVAAVLADCLACALDGLVAVNGGTGWDEQQFTALREKIAPALPTAFGAVLTAMTKALKAAVEVDREIARLREIPRPPAPVAAALADVTGQRARLLPADVATHTGQDRLADLDRYLRAAALRLSKLPTDAARDADRMQQITAVQEAFAETLALLPVRRRDQPDVREVAWSIEELRVSLFAQALGTPRPVSEQRIYRQLDALEG
jgi:ATP-dependent helicase HrpA